jgi:hypothetical protein
MGASSAMKKGKKAGREQAFAEQTVTKAKVEDLLKEERAMKGATIAGAAGSGVKVNQGSPLQILAEQAREFERERMTVKEVGATKTAAALTRSDMARTAAGYQGYSQALSSASTAFSLIANR